MRLRRDCQSQFQPRDQVSSIPIVSCSFPVISYHFLFKNKQTRKKKREVSQLIKSQVSPGNQTSNLLKKIKEGRALTDSRLSRLCVSTSTFSGIPPSPSATPHPQPPPGSSSCQEMKNKNYIFGRFDVRLTSLSSQKISVSCCLICCGE